MFIIQKAFYKSYYCENISPLLGYSVVRNLDFANMNTIDDVDEIFSFLLMQQFLHIC